MLISKYRSGLLALLFVAGCSSLVTEEVAPRSVELPLAGELSTPDAGRTATAPPPNVAIDTTAHTEGSAEYDSPHEAMQFFLDQRLPPDSREYPLEYAQRMVAEIQKRQADRSPAKSSTSWTEIGPGNVGGRTRGLLVDPVDPDIMYAGGVSGGVWKSVDAGASWTATDDTMLNLAVTTLAMDPNDRTVLYAGTGEGFDGGSAFMRGLGIFKSVDAGLSWTQLAGTVAGAPTGAFHYVNKIVISPNDSQRIYAGTRFGVWRSDNGGQDWSVVLANPFFVQGPQSSLGSLVGCTDLVIREDRNPDMIFAAFGSLQADGLYRSFDNGASWQRYGVPSNQGRMTFALAPSNNDVMYILMADNGQGGQLGQLVNIFRTVNGGASFTAQVNLSSLMGPWLLSNVRLATGCTPGTPYSQGWYDNVIAVDPFDSDVVWVGGIDILRSDDGGQNFGLAGYSLPVIGGPQPPDYIHSDKHAFVFHPQYNGTTNQTLFVGGDGGVYRTDNARAATSQENCPFPPDEPTPAIVWQELNNSYGVTQFYHGDSAQDVDTFLGGTQDNGTNLVSSQSTPDNWQHVLGGDGGYVAIDPTDSLTMYAERQFFPTIHKSTDGGASFQLAVTGITDTDGLFITPFAMDQSDPEVLWTGGRRPWRTQNGAALWESAGPDLNGPATISAIGIAPSDSNVVYMGYDNGYIVRTTNGLSASPTWTIIGASSTPAWVSSIAVDPLDPDVAYVTFSTFDFPHIFRTANGGLSWSNIDGIAATGIPDIPVHWLAIRPCDSTELYAGTEFGVFFSSDTGASWQPFNAGLPNTIVETLDFKDDDTLVAFTHGRGAFIRQLTLCGGS